MHVIGKLGWLIFGMAASCLAEGLPLAERNSGAPTGSELVRQLAPLELRAREDEIFRQIQSGNVPKLSRTFAPIWITNRIGEQLEVLKLLVTCDYLALGADTNSLRIPLTPITAQRVANLTDCTLPTPAIVAAIWRAAETKLPPTPMPPGPAMTGVLQFAEHHAMIDKERGTRNGLSLLAGHKKDVVIAAALASKSNSVVIYGWQNSDGNPIQPVYAGHVSTWADYSHGIRLIANAAELNGRPVRLPNLLTHKSTAQLVSDEGPLTLISYATNWPDAKAGKRSPRFVGTSFRPGDALKLEFKLTGRFGESEAEFHFDPEIRVVVNRAATLRATNTLLVLYALPNGNTIEQTAGRHSHTNQDWHFNIQHIAAQTRFVRERLPGQDVVVAYLEAGGLSWPSWRKKNGDATLPKMVTSLQSLCSGPQTRTVLASHSGGGSFVFGYLNAVAALPSCIERIAFLDSNYGYTAAHREKILDWLRDSDTHRLLVMAYDDAAALLNGKPFVSTEGGTWGRSALMLQQLGSELKFNEQTNGALRRHSTTDGRIEFLLRENPERKIWHTVQVERNGFIHALLTGTPMGGQDYEYLGERAYERFIADP